MTGEEAEAVVYHSQDKELVESPGSSEEPPFG
jgi:hypothetical protein